MKKRSTSKHTEQDFKDLCTAIASLNSADDIATFLEDLCSPVEIESLSDRLKVAKLVQTGMPYREISAKTGVSVTTVTRVARCLNGKTQGYALVIDKQKGA